MDGTRQAQAGRLTHPHRRYSRDRNGDRARFKGVNCAMPLLLEGKKVVVIGGSSGIGLAIARQAQAQGASLVIIGRDPMKLSNAASKLGGDVQTIGGDAHDHAALESFIAALPEFDHLVSMIGDTMAGGFLQTPLDSMRHVLHSKFWTNLLIARFAAPLVRESGSMTFTSGSGVRAQEAAASYVANEALAAMAQGLGSELGPRVRVNVIAPAFMDTALWRAKPREDIDARIRSYSQINPLGRLGTPEEVASAYIFLMVNTYTTGQVLQIDGGMMLRK
ncbi:SDR family oxidoreductase [Mesorhizobium sp. B3-2-1]|uniref:SDR family oxidoreductase n=2 Tax=Mesorhizobium TaxID=68287 RepID=UPI001AEF1797|nr:SDR family oxidoreductase [Mesorhizobium sp. B3-2-1]